MTTAISDILSTANTCPADEAPHKIEAANECEAIDSIEVSNKDEATLAINE